MTATGVRYGQADSETVLHATGQKQQPGELTKRAFLNGRLDLSQAEAVADVIHATNEYALKAP